MSPALDQYRELPVLDTRVARGPADALWLANNESWFGPSDAVRDAIERSLRDANRYPAAPPDEVKDAIAAVHGVTSDHVVVGAGSTQVLDAAIHVTVAKGDVAVMSTPTFPYYAYATRACGGVPIDVPMAGGHDLSAIAHAARTRRASVVALDNPNNPTGASSAALAPFMGEVPADAVVIVDEAYAEFTDADANEFASMVPLAARAADNVLVTRTLSKVYGLAGLRVGYAITSPVLAIEVSKAITPYSVSAVAQAAAVAALWDADEVERRARETRAWRAHLVERLAAIDVEVGPSAGNFVYVADADAASLQARIAAHGVYVRATPGGVRITVGREHEIERLVVALAAALHADRAAR